MNAFPNLSSWERNNESAGKKYSSRITHGNKYLKTTLVGSTATRSKQNPVMADLLQGKKKAAIAIGHKILIAAYHVVKPYQPSTQDKAIVEQRRLKKIERLEKQLSSLKNASYN